MLTTGIDIIIIIVLGLLFANCDGSTSSIPREAYGPIIMLIIAITIIVITLRFLIIRGIKYYKYRDETPEQRQKREEHENKMKEIKEWSRRNKC